MNIKRGDYVLEIGSGNNPRPRSDVLCDNSMEDNTERGGNIVSDRPIVEADAQDLPFKDSSFDYVICSHVLEHVEDPGRMLRELMRVAPRGYIETPSEVAERLYGWPFHRSVINAVAGKLVIRRKNFDSQFGDLFHVLAARDSAFRRFHLTHGSLLLVRHEWERRIDYEIVPEEATPVDLRSPEVIERLWTQITGVSWRSRSVSWMKRLVPRALAAWGKSALARARPGQRRDIRDVIVCPACKGPVVWASDRISCGRCAIDFPIVGGVPRMVRRSL